MPLTEKGEKIKSAMEKQYGKEKGERVFYASENKGNITGIKKGDDMPIAPIHIERLGEIVNKADAAANRFDAFMARRRLREDEKRKAKADKKMKRADAKMKMADARMAKAKKKLDAIKKMKDTSGIGENKFEEKKEEKEGEIKEEKKADKELYEGGSHSKEMFDTQMESGSVSKRNLETT